jgi:hypothetical protein
MLEVGLSIVFLLADGVAQPTETCSRLAGEFEQTERSMAFTHDLNQRKYEIERDYARNLGVGTTRDMLEARQELEDDDREYLEKGDRIIELMKGHACSLPNHIMSWQTYSDAARFSQPQEEADRQPSERGLW